MPGRTDVVAGQHRMHAGHRPCRGDIDGDDARVRVRAAQEGDVEHPLDTQIPREPRASSDLLVAFNPIFRVTDQRRHAVSPGEL